MENKNANKSHTLGSALNEMEPIILELKHSGALSQADMLVEDMAGIIRRFRCSEFELKDFRFPKEIPPTRTIPALFKTACAYWKAMDNATKHISLDYIPIHERKETLELDNFNLRAVSRIRGVTEHINEYLKYFGYSLKPKKGKQI